MAQALAWCIGRYRSVRDEYREGIAELERFLGSRRPRARSASPC